MEVILKPKQGFPPPRMVFTGFKQFVSRLATAFPDLHITIEDMISEVDKVVARVTVRATHKGTFMGSIPPTGKEVIFTGVDIFQISGGKIIGRWNQRDLLGLMQQLGLSQCRDKASLYVYAVFP